MERAEKNLKAQDSQQAQQDQQHLQRDGAAWLKPNKWDDILMISLALVNFVHSHVTDSLSAV